MSDSILQTMIWAGASVFGLFLLCLFASIDGDSNFKDLVSAWKAKRLAELEVESARAAHERTCPRLTDTPRRP